MKRTSFGFTLVELIVSMVVLAVLATISVVYFLTNVSESRDSQRLSEIETIEKAFDVFKTKRGRYPIPDDSVDITYSGSVVWTQGTFGENVNQNLGIFGSDFPVDPYYENEYTYSITNGGKEYQIATILENIEEEEGLGEVASLFVEQTHAVSLTNAYVKGSYNGFMARAIYGGDNYFIATPSIITYDITDTDVLSTIANQKLVFNEFFNLPHSYESVIDDLDGGFSFDIGNPVLFSGSIDEAKTEAGMLAFQENLKYTYSILPIESLDKYEAVTQSEGIVRLKRLLENSFDVYFQYYINCLDVKDHQGTTDGSDYYTIDPDGPGGTAPYSVYCDMTTDGGGWTQVGGDYITYGDFASGTGITSEWGSNSNNTVVNLGTANTPVTSGYALHQTSDAGWSDDQKSRSEYEVHFDDADLSTSGYQFPSSVLSPGNEIRMYARVRDDDSAATWTGCTTAPCNHNPYGGYIFHNRLFYSDGTNEVNGTVEVLDTVTTDDGATWEYQRVRKKIRKQASGFNWYIGYGAELDTDLYVTGIKLEVFYR